MTLGQFRKITETYPDNLELYIGERTTDFAFAPVESVERKVIKFSEEPDSEALSEDEVITLTED